MEVRELEASEQLTLSARLSGGLVLDGNCPLTSRSLEWISSNPEGPCRLWVGEEEGIPVCSTGLIPWWQGQGRAWQLGLSWVAPSWRGRGYYSDLLATVFNDLTTRPVTGNVYTLPTPGMASEKALSRRLEWQTRRGVPRHCLWIHPLGSPLRRLGPWAGLASFLLPPMGLRIADDAKVETSTVWPDEAVYSDRVRRFMEWRFLRTPIPWTLWVKGGETFIFREEPSRPEVVQIGLWPTSQEAAACFLGTLVSRARARQWRRVEWAAEEGVLGAPSAVSLKSWGFRTAFLLRPTHRNLLLATDNPCIQVSRLDFDT